MEDPWRPAAERVPGTVTSSLMALLIIATNTSVSTCYQALIVASAGGCEHRRQEQNTDVRKMEFVRKNEQN